MSNYIHTVYFAFTDHSPEAAKEFATLCQRLLAGHPGELAFYISTRNPTLTRHVNDLDFDVALNIVFRTLEDHDAYQTTSTRHDEFRTAISQIPGITVRVFDSITT